MDSQLAFDALILAGGRSSRLGGTPKQSLLYDGGTLLGRAVAVALGAVRTAVVGPDPGTLPPGVLSCRENPPFAGPAAAIAAGLDALASRAADHTPDHHPAGSPDHPARRPSAFTLVLACDMPRAEAAIVRLREALAAADPLPDAVVACSEDGTMQPLAGFYRTEALQMAVDRLADTGALINASVRSLLASLDLQLVTVPAGSTADVDTWDDAAALGIAAGHQPSGPDRRGRSQLGRQTVKSQEETLEEWCRSLLQAYELEDVQVDINAILGLAGVAAHSVVRPAAPLTTFIAGLAAGLASGAGGPVDSAAMESALALAKKLAAAYDAEAPETPGE